MTAVVFYKLLAIIATAAFGYVAGRMKWLTAGGGDDTGAAPRVLANTAFYIFVPALLFRTTARLDLAHMPWRTVAAFFVPVVAVMLLVVFTQRGAAKRHGPAAPAVRGIAATFGNSIQVGIPFAAALFGEAGLAVHIALVSLHALVLLSVVTTLAELDLARAHAGGSVPLARTLAQTVRNTVIHPVVLPVLAGLAWNFTGWGIHPVIDEALVTAAQGVVPLCLVLIGVTLATYGLQGRLRGAVWLSAVKLLLLPALVLVVARWGFGLTGTPLAVMVMMAAMPTGSNALIFAQRYRALEAEVTAAAVVSTAAFAVTAPAWLLVLGRVG